jgi:hypothetical protein
VNSLLESEDLEALALLREPPKSGKRAPLARAARAPNA